MKKTILQIRNLTKQALTLDHGYMFEFQQIKRFNILTIFLMVMNGLTNNTRYSKNRLYAMSSIFAITRQTWRYFSGTSNCGFWLIDDQWSMFTSTRILTEKLLSGYSELWQYEEGIWQCQIIIHIGFSGLRRQPAKYIGKFGIRYIQHKQPMQFDITFT